MSIKGIPFLLRCNICGDAAFLECQADECQPTLKDSNYPNAFADEHCIERGHPVMYYHRCNDLIGSVRVSVNDPDLLQDYTEVK